MFVKFGKTKNLFGKILILLLEVSPQAVPCASQAAEPPRPFAPGLRVKIHGLQSEGGKKLNGILGFLRKFDSATGRWDVRVATETKALKPENLVVDESSGPGIEMVGWASNKVCME